MVAGELEEPQVPEFFPKPPSVRLPTLMLRPLPMLAVAVPLGAMLKLPTTEVPVATDFAPEPLKMRLLYGIALTF